MNVYVRQGDASPTQQASNIVDARRKNSYHVIRYEIEK